MATQFADVRFNGLGAFSPSGTGIGYLRPDADDVDGGWTNELDGNVLFSSIDEAGPADDNDYIKSSENPVADACQVRLSNPSSLVTTPAKIRTRYKKSTASGTFRLTVRLKQGVTEIAEWLYPLSDTFTTSEETLTTPQFNSITDFNDLFLEFEADVSDPLQDLIDGLTTDGVFAKLDRLWVFAQATQASALVDLVASATATAVNSPTFTANRGYVGEDLLNTTKYIDLGFNASTAGGNYTQNAAHLSAWSVTNTATVNGGAIIGCSNTTTIRYSELFDTFSDGNIYARINDSPVSGSQGAPGTRIGHWLINRSGAATTQCYQNASLFASPNVASGTLLNFTFTALATRRVDIPSVQFGTPNQIAMVSIGGNLNSTEVTAFYNRLRTYMTAVGVP